MHESVAWFHGGRHVSEELSPEACRSLLASHHIGRVAHVVRGRVLVLPVNYLFHEGDVFVRTAGEGALGRDVLGHAASLQIDEFNEAQKTGWAVLAIGTAAPVDEPELLRTLWGRMSDEPWAPGERRLFIRLRVTEVTGRKFSTA